MKTSKGQQIGGRRQFVVDESFSENDKKGHFLVSQQKKLHNLSISLSLLLFYFNL